MVGPAVVVIVVVGALVVVVEVAGAKITRFRHCLSSLVITVVGNVEIGDFGLQMAELIQSVSCFPKAIPVATFPVRIPKVPESEEPSPTATTLTPN